MSVNLFFEDTEILDLNPEFFVSWLGQVCKAENNKLGEMSIVFCSDNYLLELNRKHLNHDYFTDIITFDYSEDMISGDLFVSVDRVRDNASSNNVIFKEELYRVVVHGVLHLIGYKDKEEKDIIIMREKEELYLSKIVSRET